MSDLFSTTPQLSKPVAGLIVKILPIVSIIFPLLAYVAILTIGVPNEIGLAARYSFAPVLVMIVLLLYPAYRQPGWIGVLAALSLTLILFALPLSGLWSSGISEELAIIGGLLPRSDALVYYLDAQRLLEGGTFSAFSSRRPLFAGMLATVLGLTQQNLQVTLAILVLITAISCYLLTREVQRSHGTVAGLLVLAILFLFYRRFIGTVLTENLGLSLGAIGFAILWRGTRQKCMSIIFLGIFLLTLALNARAGAFFVLPSLVLWGAWVFRGNSRFSLHFLVGGIGAVLLGFLLNFAVLRSVGAPDRMAFSNFSDTLYGQVVGGKGWTQVMIDHPELAHIDDPERSRRIYQLAFEAFQANPFGLAFGSLKAWLEYLNPQMAFGFVHSNILPLARLVDNAIRAILPLDRLAAFATRIFLFGFSLWGLLACYRQRKDLNHSLIIAASLGILISVPLIPPSDGGGMRVYAATMPISALLVALGVVQGITFMAQRMKKNLPTRNPETVGFPKAPIIFGIALAAFVVLGPILTKATRGASQFAEVPCSSGTDTAYVRISAGSSVTLVDEDSFTRWTLFPTVHPDDFRRGLNYLRAPETARELAGLSDSTVILNALNLKDGQPVFLIAKSSMMPKASGIIKACRKNTSAGFFHADSIREIVMNHRE